MQDMNKATLKQYLTDATSQESMAKGLNYNLEKIAGNAEEEKKKSNKK
jgi:hypothetical protein